MAKYMYLVSVTFDESTSKKEYTYKSMFPFPVGTKLATNPRYNEWCRVTVVSVRKQCEADDLTMYKPANLFWSEATRCMANLCRHKLYSSDTISAVQYARVLKTPFDGRCAADKLKWAKQLDNANEVRIDKQKKAYYLINVTFDDAATQKHYTYKTEFPFEVGDKLAAQIDSSNGWHRVTVQEVQQIDEPYFHINVADTLAFFWSEMVRYKTKDLDHVNLPNTRTMSALYCREVLTRNFARRRTDDKHYRTEYSNLAVREAAESETHQENVMKLKIESTVLVNGEPIKSFSDEALFNTIKQAEDEIKRLSELKATPKRVLARIEELQAGINALVEAMDSQS